METICNYLEDFYDGDMILYRPYEASRRTTTLIVKGTMAKLYIYDSAWSRNLSLNDGSFVDLISGLALSCSLSVGILVYMNDARKGEYKGGAF